MDDLKHCWSDCQRLLVFGVESTIGANLALALSDRFAVLGLCQRRPVSLEGCHTTLWNEADSGGLGRLIREHRPHWILHCGPFCSSSWDMPQEIPSADEQARTLRRLAGVAAEVGSRLTVLSTDAVFAGPRMFHGETDPTASLRPFARAALRAERALQDSNALVVRTHAYGWSPAGSEPGFAERVWQGVLEASPYPVTPHCHATPILASDLAEVLWLAYRRRLQGLYHMAGAERTSQRRFSTELAATFGLTHATPPSREGPLDPPVFQETSLDTRRARRGLLRGMPMLRECLDRFAQQARNGFRTRLRNLAAEPALKAA